MSEKKKPWLAGLLSFIISGAGQIYTGAFRIGIFFIILYVLLIIGGGFEIFHPVARLLFILSVPPILWVAAIIHAVLYARKVNVQP
ncbi:hypothetical protein [Salicibibacter kimchii]|uniref:TM2 domain-containing protein n=1 Tax=Salicibibacter kimchii TaxID=2099786 RepID=A0A345BUW2_9BACI|nr:hypothetical protein [Salicibibacter kimchii]AXF54743.1 hypothetical protein DT065_01045 [Salicibibacter kimchii]